MTATLLRVISALACAAAIGACVDYGYDAPTYEDPEPVGGDDQGVGDEDCVEGVATPSTTGPRVRYSGFTAIPLAILVSAGDVVTWVNEDAMVHTVTAGTPDAALPLAEGGFDSGDIAGGASWAYRFCTPRTAMYFCRPHKAMMFGYEVIVQ